ncbi:hypothetical protein CHGG_11113 [Chaetomium globosum CBS 148.51]|uniref:Reverse transcriptase domain-containing protein n=1 Tax=Chaetomium globosum (strain ATCC 6205 / CBS 148.51 / DSM 1962 / NBRC 6347 / NRRL 1970) TaxID=306901 RepID=Q2GLW5_CHAGB|nr:uncharacterized protein CHGG_11113 [Chaetomium globosum CBS 148.51]EAQ82861.1 hypothetical protein CHGG_11113 [Chaetomium globosum CBS 148.51]
MGNRAHRSTELAVRLVVAQVQEAWRQKGAASLLQLDISGAFDTVNHTRLLATLREMGFPRWLVLWTRDWLTGREATLLFDGKTAAPTAIRAEEQLKDEHPHLSYNRWTEQVNLANPGGGTSPVKPEGSARFLGVWLDWKLNWKAHLVAVEKKLRTQSYALSRIVAKTWGMGLAKAREVYTKCIRSALAYGASSFHIPTDVGGEPAKKGITKALGKAQNKSLRIVAGAFKSTPIRNLETETWVPPLDLVVEEAWKARWLKERDGRAITRPADDFDHQQETLFRNETLRRHDGLSKAKSSLLIQIRTGAIGLRDFLFTRGVPEVLTPACECGEGRETAEHLVVWCLAPPLTRRWERTGIRTRRDFYSVLHGINPTTARLARRVLDWLMDSGKLPMYNLARRLELEAAA